MRLWLDGQCLQTTSRLRGIGRYVTELIRAISENCPEVEMSISFNAVLTDAAIAARASVADWIAPHNIHVWQSEAAVSELRTGRDPIRHLGEVALAHHVACLAPDIALSASPFEGQHDPAAPLLTRAGHDFPWAAIFYDAIPYRYPARYLNQGDIAAVYRRRMEALAGFDVLLAISGFARSEALDILPGTRAVQIDAGVSSDFLKLVAQPVAPLHALEVRAPFLLYVGALDWRKNVMGVIDAFRFLSPQRRETLQFVVAGDGDQPGQRKARAAWMAGGLNPDNLRILGHVSDQLLVQLYKQAALVIQPSLMEGFGLTALEAMVCGAPVIAANAGALPEVVGDTRALFDPERPQSIAARIEQVLSDTPLARELVEKGIAHSRNFTWARTARLAVDALASVAREKARPPMRDISALRRITAGALGVPEDAERAARILAAAEPPAVAPGRLLIDVTSTTENDHGTGIQRVVNNVARELLAGGTPERQLFWCDSTAGFFAARFGGQGKLERLAPSEAHHFYPRNGDHIVMLDSSWAHENVYATVMRRARLQGCEITSVMYDMVPLKMPAFCDRHMPPAFAKWLKSALGYSTGFICISRAVADELLALLDAIAFPRPMKVGYWRLGADLPQGQQTAQTRTDLGAPPLFLMVGTLEPRKGHRVALEAFSQLWSQGFAGHLTIIGKRGWAMDHLVQALNRHPEWGRKLHWLEGCSDDVLRDHYAACTALVIPSFGEGFGLPIVEAAWHHKPVIASDIPVFREVAEGADVRFFATGSPDALAEAVRDFSGRAPAATPARKAPHVTWAASAAGFERVVQGGEWYRHYKPKHPAADISLDYIGDLAPSGDEATRYSLELLEGPLSAGENTAGRRLSVRLSNLGEVLWSGSRFTLGYRLLDAGGKTVFFEKAAARIPLVQLPGDAHFLSLLLAGKGMRKGAQSAEIALFDGDQGLWASALRIALTR